MLQFGIGLPVVQQVPAHAQRWEAAAGPGELLAVAQTADRLGYAWVACSDHVAIPASHTAAIGSTWYEPMTTLAYLAAATTRVRLLCHVLVLPYRHPLTAAKMIATVDTLSSGRLLVGAGAGHLRPEFRSLGIDPGVRAAMADEYLRAIAAALETAVSTFDGQFVRWRDMVIAPRPVQHPRPPLWVGGNGMAAAQRAGRYGNGWIPWQLECRELAARAAAARAAYAATGRVGEFAVVAPLAAERVDEPGLLLDAVAAWRQAGATAFHVGFRHHSCGDLRELLERFAVTVAAVA